ncbi:synemin [Aplochiton taeniatus]
MMQFRRTFETEKHQLQELNNRLGQYLSRTNQLEHENVCLVAEINKLRQAKTLEWESQYKAEMRELRRVVGQLSFEKSQAEMEKKQLWREFQMVQALCREETVVSKDIEGEIRGYEKELQHVQKNNCALEERLFHLQNEYKCLEDAHKKEIGHLRNQVHSQVVPIVSKTYHGPPTVSMEEMQEYARSLSEGWIETFEMYQQRVEEMEESIKADQTRLDDLQREKMLYASEFKTLRVEAEKQSGIQMHLEDQLMHLQGNFHQEVKQYQMAIAELEHERQMLANSMADKLHEHQLLLQVKTDLSMEVASYRALLEGERIDIDSHRRANQHQRERIIEIKRPSQPYTQRAATSTNRQHLDVRYMEPTYMRRSPVPAGSTSPSRVIPISVGGKAQQSTASRRDMLSFTKAQNAVSNTKSAAKPAYQPSADVQRKPVEEKRVKQHSSKEKFSPMSSPTGDPKSVKVVSPPMMSLGKNQEEDRKKKVKDGREERGNAEDRTQSEKKDLDTEYMEQIIEKAIRPAGSDSEVSSPGDSKITYHVEKTQQEDGSTKTQIFLESKVEEEMDFSEDSALDELLSRGTKTMTLEDIKGTSTGTMIQNLLAGLQQGEDLSNKSVSVEIVEEPADSDQSDEKNEVEERSGPQFAQPSSMFYQIEELESDAQESKHHQREEGMSKASKAGHSPNGSVKVQEGSLFSRDREPRDYFVSTPDDSLSEHEDGSGIASYGHYGVVDDLSDERYYQEGGLPGKRMFADDDDEDYKFMKSDLSFVKESFPECIIEEEVRVSPTVQESVLEYLKGDSMDPQEQLRGALEQLQGSMSGSLKEELALLAGRDRDSPQNMSVDIRKVQQSSDNGTTTIVAKLNVSQSLEDSGLSEEGDLSEEQIMAAFRSSNPEFQKALQGGAEGGYTVKVSRELDGTGNGESATEVSERQIKLGPSEESFTFQMDDGDTQEQEMGKMQATKPSLKVLHEKRVATVYLESSDK